ncbi:peptidylprolyl isomerase [Altibacter sp. HG106]|uniref:peptidylprolyl isomerase n=1 Tax=Altibacter sp. HG106 TaxID=3023937 RepID=UPI002350AE6B|nr:peptidylprolyl isomerase [Altibacter sp. HG106]MDC7996279.1 peptidylprolyl isomerase [Altibacter sp. HG106]
MKNCFCWVCLLFFITVGSTAQQKDAVLMTIGDTPISSAEFKRVFKKNLDLVQDESQKTVEGYLDLFVDYKLKVIEARAQGLDTEKAYLQEFSRYQDQLSRSYIYEDKITEDLAKEAYERSLEEVDANHILIQVNYNDLPQDTLAAYQKIVSIREKAVAGEDFETLAKTYSEEPGAKERAGALGYFSVFQMVYPFEDAAYATPVGEISEIIRTSFGYHILKVNDRRARPPQIVVSHIMISDNSGTRTFDPKERINELNTLLQQGEDFEALAKQYSEDRASAKNGGRLRPFSRGDLRAEAFEEAAYALENPGDLTGPVRSRVGWHIIRLEERLDRVPFETQKEDLEKRVSQGDRAKRVTATITNNIKDKYGFAKGEQYIPFFTELVNDSLQKRKWTFEGIDASEDALLFTIGKKQYRYSDFARFIEDKQRSLRLPREKGAALVTLYDTFEHDMVMDYYKNQLELENDQYAAVINEYRDGLLIFDVMNQNVWNKAKTDSIGLERYFEQHRNAYQWKKRVKARIVSATNQAKAEEAAAWLKDTLNAEALKEKLNTEETVSALVSEGTFELGHQALPSDFKPQLGISKIYNENGSFIVVAVSEILAPGPKQLEEVKGRVLSDYQQELERAWMESLRKKYPVKMNQKVLKKVKKELQS